MMNPFVLGAIFGGVVAFGAERTGVQRSGLIVAPRRALDDKQLAVNQLTRSCALSQQASALINQGVPMMSWQKSKIAVIEDNLASVLRGLQATQQRPSLGFSPSSGVDEALRADMASYANERAAEVRKLQQGKVSLDDLDVAQGDAQEALDALDEAILGLRGAAGQLQRTQRGTSEGSRNRLRRLVEATNNLLDTYFQGASKSWDSVLPPLPQTPIGPSHSSFGAVARKPAPMSAYVTVETDDGSVRISAASALSSEAVSDLADGIIDAAKSIQTFSFRSQRRSTGVPLLPGAAIQQTLRAESSLIPGGLL